MDQELKQLVDLGRPDECDLIKLTASTRRMDALQHEQAGKLQNRGGNLVDSLHEIKFQEKFIFLASNPSNPVERDINNIPQSLWTMKEYLKRARGHETTGVHKIEKSNENGRFLLLVIEELQKKALHVAPGVAEVDVTLDLLMNPMLYPESLELLAKELRLSGTVSFENKPAYVQFLLKLAGDLLDI